MGEKEEKRSCYIAVINIVAYLLVATIAKVIMAQPEESWCMASGVGRQNSLSMNTSQIILSLSEGLCQGTVQALGRCVRLTSLCGPCSDPISRMPLSILGICSVAKK